MSLIIRSILKHILCIFKSSEQMRLEVIFQLKVSDENKLFFQQLYTQTLDHKETPSPFITGTKKTLLHLFGVLLGVDTSLSTPTHCVKWYRQRPKT